jgi:hypothetical protein
MITSSQQCNSTGRNSKQSSSSMKGDDRHHDQQQGSGTSRGRMNGSSGSCSSGYAQQPRHASSGAVMPRHRLHSHRLQASRLLTIACIPAWAGPPFCVSHGLGTVKSSPSWRSFSIVDGADTARQLPVAQTCVECAVTAPRKGHCKHQASRLITWERNEGSQQRAHVMRGQRQCWVTYSAVRASPCARLMGRHFDRKMPRCSPSPIGQRLHQHVAKLAAQPGHSRGKADLRTAEVADRCPSC